MFIKEFYSNIPGIDTFVPLFATKFRGTRIIVTLDLISKVLHVLRVVHPNYPGCDRLRTMSKDKLMSLFCEIPSVWDDHLNTRCSTYVKGLRFLNMVKTFILHSLSHYNTITEPRAHFLLSIIEDLSIDFPSHFIFSLTDVYRDTTTRNKLIFLLAIRRILHHFFVSYPPFDPFFFMGAIDTAIIQRSIAQLRQRQP